MRINIKATGTTLTPSISEYIEKKINMLEKFFQEGARPDEPFGREALINVEVGRTTKHHKSGDIFRAEIRINYEGQEYYSVAEEEDLYAAIDEVKDEIVHEMTSRRKKTFHLMRHGGAKIKNLLKGYFKPRKKSS